MIDAEKLNLELTLMNQYLSSRDLTNYEVALLLQLMKADAERRIMFPGKE